jgi:hypothetical protein
MKNDPLLAFRIFSGFALMLSIFALSYVLKNAERLFGIDGSVPSENSSSRTYNRFLVFAVLAHAVVLFSTGMLLL